MNAEDKDGLSVRELHFAPTECVFEPDTENLGFDFSDIGECLAQPAGNKKIDGHRVSWELLAGFLFTIRKRFKLLGMITTTVSLDWLFQNWDIMTRFQHPVKLI